MSDKDLQITIPVQKNEKIEKKIFKIFGPPWGSLGTSYLGPQTEFPKTPR